MKKTYDVEYRIDRKYDYEDWQYSNQFRTLNQAKKFVAELEKKYGTRLSDAIIKLWEVEDEDHYWLIDTWDYDTETRNGHYYHI
jgi:hypothetical protein